MNWTFLIILCIFMITFIAISYVDSKKTDSFKNYSVAGKIQNTPSVIMTLLATMIGASATVGVADTVRQIGFPGVWWLLFGAIGLILQAFLISEKVRETNADTLPELAKITVGRGAELIISIVIVVSWIGIIAGQLVAMNGIITFATGKESKLIFAIVSIIVIIYTLLGGQLSVVKTDKIQLCFVLLGLIICLVWLYTNMGANNTEILSNIELLNDNYTPQNLITQFFVIGGVYFLGPDILSRNLLSKNKKTAAKSALAAGIIFIVFAFIIAFLGMWVKYNVPEDKLGELTALMYIVSIVPKPVSILMGICLLAAILSSTDTCLINAASILSKDIMKKDDVKIVRICVAIIGIISLVLALSGQGDILTLLSGAYSIYTPGVIFPLLIAILCYKKKEINTVLWMIGVACGGILGLISTYLGEVLVTAGIPNMIISNLTLIGMGLSLIFALLSIFGRKPDGGMQKV